MGWMDCPPVSPGGGSEVPEALLEPGVGAGRDENIYVPLNGINQRYKGQIGEFNESCMVRKNLFLAFCTH